MVFEDVIKIRISKYRDNVGLLGRILNAIAPIIRGQRSLTHMCAHTHTGDVQMEWKEI